MTSTPYGFRVVGATWERRRAIEHVAAFQGYALLDPKAEPDREAYLSIFTFGDDFLTYLETNNNSTKGYDGPCGAPFLWWDLDRPGDLERALRDARRLAGFLLERYPSLDDNDLLAFFSGSKGCHLGLPAFWSPEPSTTFHRAARRFAERFAEMAQVGPIDGSVYDKVRLFRAPNSRHAKTGLFKRRLSLDELAHLAPESVLDLAREPIEFDMPMPRPSARDLAQAGDDWRVAVGEVQQHQQVRASHARRQSSGEARRLSAFAMRFIRDGELDASQRAISLFRVAAELAEWGCPDGLAQALLTESALDSGLSPSEVKRQIECGLKHGASSERAMRHCQEFVHADQTNHVNTGANP